MVQQPASACSETTHHTVHIGTQRIHKQARSAAWQVGETEARGVDGFKLRERYLSQRAGTSRCHCGSCASGSTGARRCHTTGSDVHTLHTHAPRGWQVGSTQFAPYGVALLSDSSKPTVEQPPRAKDKRDSPRQARRPPIAHHQSCTREAHLQYHSALHSSHCRREGA